MITVYFLGVVPRLDRGDLEHLLCLNLRGDAVSVKGRPDLSNPMSNETDCGSAPFGVGELSLGVGNREYQQKAVRRRG